MGSARVTWAIVVGEYPPQPGGVSDYTRQIAEALAAVGDDVHVLAPRVAREGPAYPGVTIHRLPDRYGIRGIFAAMRIVRRLPKSTRVLVQFVVQSFGMRAMNVPFAIWLLALRPDVMFHETVIKLDARMNVPRKIQAIVTQIIGFAVMRSARRTFVSTPAWIPRIRAWAPKATPIHLYIPSNVATTVEAAAVASTALQLRDGRTGPILGHFGTYNMSQTRSFLRDFVPLFLERHPTATFALVGRGGGDFARSLLEGFPAYAPRITACVGDSREDVATSLAACDILIQPYYDGATTRRTSLAAGLALGKPTVSNDGYATEAIWRSSGAVALASSFEAESVLIEASRLLADENARLDLGRRAAALYGEHFEVARTIEGLKTGL